MPPIFGTETSEEIAGNSLESTKEEDNTQSSLEVQPQAEDSTTESQEGLT